MKTDKLLKKYSILLLIYVLLFRVIEPYGLKIYYSIVVQPDITTYTIETIQSVLYTVAFFVNLIFALIIILDSKKKKLIDWMIILITLFSVETGVIFFLIWQFYKDFKIKNEAKDRIL